jgi:hypothetical protein
MLSLRYKRQFNNISEEKDLVVTQFKVKCRNCGKIGYKTAQCKSKQMREKRHEITCNYFMSLGHVKSNCFKLIKKKQVAENRNGTRNGVVGFLTDIVLSSIESENDVEHDICIRDRSSLRHYCNDDEGLYEYKTILEEITVGNGIIMISKKAGKLR